MLKTRIIPTLLWKDVGLVKGAGFDSWRRVGSVLPSVRVYNLREVDELIILDIAATQAGRDIDFDAVREFAADCFVPLTVGGGIQDIDTTSRLLRSGADKVSINSSAYQRPGLIRDIADRFGSQCVVASIDARMTTDGYRCFAHCGQKQTGRAVADWAREVEQMGAGEILITSVERDGTMQGYDQDLILEVTRNVSIPVIASGGAGTFEHLYEAVSRCGASAVAAASIFHFTEMTPRDAKDYLDKRGIAVRR